jgi:hypothetical protein
MEQRARRVYDRNYEERNSKLENFISALVRQDCSRKAGVHIRSPQRKLWVQVADWPKLAKRATQFGCVTIQRYLYMSPRCGSHYLRNVFPQLALWATNMPLASPTG